MATTVEELDIVIDLETGPLAKNSTKARQVFDKNFKKMTGSTKKLNTAVKKSGKGISGLKSGFARLAGALAGAFGIMKLFTGVMKSFADKDALGKTAQRLGLTTEALAGLNLLAEKAGTSVENMQMSLQRMNRRLAEAAEGTGTASDQLKKMGLDAQALIQLSPDKSFALIADEINKLGTAAERTAAEFDIFGLSGAQLDLAIRAGADGIKKAREEAIRFGTAVSALDANKAAVVNDAFSDMQHSLRGIFNVISEQLSPAFFAMAKVVTEIAVKFRENQKEAGNFGNVALAAVGAVATIIHAMMIAWEGVKLAVLAVVATMATQMAFAANIITDVVTRVIAFGTVLSGIMEDPEAAMSAAWLTIKRVSLQAIQATIQALGDQLTAMAAIAGEGQIGDNLLAAATGLANVTTKLAIGAQQAKDELKQLTAESSGLSKVADGLKTITAGFDPTKAKKTGIEFIDSMANGVNENASVLRDATVKQFNQLMDTANMFGGQTAFGFVMGMQEVFDKEVKLTMPKIEGTEITSTGDPLEDERIVREKMVQEKLKSLDQERIASERNDFVAQQTFWKTSLQNRLSVASSIMGDLATLMQSKSRKMFEVGKVAAMSQAVVDTWASANKAMSTLPYPLNLAAAAATVAAGMVNVQNIRAQQFSKGGGGGSSGGGGGGGGSLGAVGAAEAAPQNNTTFNVALQGQSFGGQQVRGLINQINEGTDDNVTLNVTQRVD